MAIRFKELKNYIARDVKLSICFRNGRYENYLLISDIPEGRYDELYVYGIGMVDVEFPMDVYKRPFIDFPEKLSCNHGYYIGCGLEIVLQDEPRDIPRQKENVLNFCDLRGYLQIGMNFSVVMREDWSAEQYMWKKDIPELYNDLYLYGIGVEDMQELPEGLDIQYARVKDMSVMKQMVLVLSKTPRTDVGKKEVCSL